MTSTATLRTRLKERCLDLLRIESVTGNEQAIADHLQRWALQQSGFGRDDVLRHGNALILGSYDEQRPCLALVGHMDTVPAAEGYAGPAEDGDHLIGLGASDMKGAVAVMQTLAELLDIKQLPFSLVLVLYDREEGAYVDNGLQPLLERFDILQHIDLAIAMEPTNNTLQLGCLGSIHARFRFHGKAAHSARPWQGENAIHKATDLLMALRDRPVRDVHVDGLTFREAMSATLAEGGRARNVIPDRCDINVNYRFAPGADLAAVTQRALAEVRGLTEAADVEVVDVAPPGGVPVDNPIFEHLKAHADLPVEPKQAWTDVARLAAHGIDAINFGPGATAQAHQSGEWVSLDALVEAYDVLARTLTAPLHAL